VDVHSLKLIPPEKRPNDPGPPTLRIHAHDPGAEYRTGDGRRTPSYAKPEARTPPEPPVDMRMVARNAVLRHKAKSEPLTPILRGDVAWVGQKLMARAEWGPATLYAELALDADLNFQYEPEFPRDHDLVGGAIIVDWSRAARGGAPSDPPGQWHPFDPTTPEDRQIARFIADYRIVASMLGIVPLSTYQRFQPGPIVRQAKLPPGVEIPWARLLNDHCCGIYGVHGESSDAPLTAGELFALGFQPIGRQNDHAMQTRYGAVRSSFILPDAVQAQFPALPPYQTPIRRTVAILTVLEGGSSRTEMKLGAHHEASEPGNPPG
jgi:hypothetical protein